MFVSYFSFYLPNACCLRKENLLFTDLLKYLRVLLEWYFSPFENIILK